MSMESEKESLRNIRIGSHLKLEIDLKNRTSKSDMVNKGLDIKHRMHIIIIIMHIIIYISCILLYIFIHFSITKRLFSFLILLTIGQTISSSHHFFFI